MIAEEAREDRAYWNNKYAESDPQCDGTVDGSHCMDYDEGWDCCYCGESGSVDDNEVAYRYG